MPVDSIVRVSFQSNVKALQQVNAALVGHVRASSGSGPFQRIGTAAYSCSAKGEWEVTEAIARLFAALVHHAISIDFVSITMAHKQPMRYKRVAEQ